MNIFITKYVNLFLISINLISHNVDAFNCTDLKLICAPRYGLEITPTPPPLCTALSLTMYNKKLLADLKSIKGNLPLMVIDDRYLIAEWADIFKDPVSDYMKKMIELGVDVIAMDIIRYFLQFRAHEESKFTEDIINFIKSVKREYPKILIGIAFASHEDPKIHSIDVKKINSHVDFYLLKFLQYKLCEYANKPRDMVYSVTKDDIKSTVTLFRDCGMDTSKLIYTIDLRIFTVKKKVVADSFEEMASSQLCSKEVSKNRRFCFNTIPDLFDKAQVCVKEKLLGIYIDNTDYDDYDGSCNCVGPDREPIKFKGISVIAGACCDDKANVSSFNCPSDYPTITTP